jgi:hypothetical protein
MRFNIRGIPQDISVTTVVLEYNPNVIQNNSPEGLLLWHCPIDNSPLFQFSAHQVMIIPGMVPTKLPIINQCPKCKQKYLVISVI